MQLVSYSKIDQDHTDGDDVLQGGDGDDRIHGDGRNDILIAGAGDNYLSGGDGDDKLFGGTGNDVMLGGEGADQLNCGDGVGTILDYHRSQGDIITANCEIVNSLQ
jgi:serralysin